MDRTTIDLYYLSMEYFSELEWIMWAHQPRCMANLDHPVHPHWSVSFACDGEVEFFHPHPTPVKIKAPFLWLDTPGHGQSFRMADGRPWNHYFVTIRGKRARRYQEQGLFSTDRRVLHVSEKYTWQMRFTELLTAIEKPMERQGRAVWLLEGLLLDIARLREGHPGENTPSSRIIALLTRIKQYPQKEWNMDVEAQRAGLSYTHFRRIFTRMAGLSPTRYISRCRLERATQLLTNTDLNIKEIAEESGYQDIHFFSKSFHQRYGIPPSRFRAFTTAMNSIPHKIPPYPDHS